MSFFNRKQKPQAPPAKVQPYTQELEDHRNQFPLFFAHTDFVELITRDNRGNWNEVTKIFMTGGGNYILPCSRSQHADLCKKFEIVDIKSAEVRP